MKKYRAEFQLKTVLDCFAKARNDDLAKARNDGLAKARNDGLAKARNDDLKVIFSYPELTLY